jgi:hypothetical protein
MYHLLASSSSYSYSSVLDIVLTFTWAVIAAAGVAFQMWRERHRPPFPPAPGPWTAWPTRRRLINNRRDDDDDDDIYRGEPPVFVVVPPPPPPPTPPIIPTTAQPSAPSEKTPLLNN